MVATRKSRFYKWTAIGFVIIAALITFEPTRELFPFLWVSFRMSIAGELDLPPFEQIVAISASFYDPAQRKMVEFDVPKTCWTELYSALTRPTGSLGEVWDWKVMCQLTIRTDKERVCRVDVFKLDDEPVGVYQLNGGTKYGRF